ncbi:hypothetical protein D3C87_2208930 [compost metagenome]
MDTPVPMPMRTTDNTEYSFPAMPTAAMVCSPRLPTMSWSVSWSNAIMRLCSVIGTAILNTF